jgi:hypothetical protein
MVSYNRLQVSVDWKQCENDDAGCREVKTVNRLSGTRIAKMTSIGKRVGNSTQRGKARQVERLGRTALHALLVTTTKSGLSIAVKTVHILCSILAHY